MATQNIDANNYTNFDVTSEISAMSSGDDAVITNSGGNEGVLSGVIAKTDFGITSDQYGFRLTDAYSSDFNFDFTGATRIDWDVDVKGGNDIPEYLSTNKNFMGCSDTTAAEDAPENINIGTKRQTTFTNMERAILYLSRGDGVNIHNVHSLGNSAVPFYMYRVNNLSVKNFLSRESGDDSMQIGALCTNFTVEDYTSYNAGCFQGDSNGAGDFGGTGLRVTGQGGTIKRFRSYDSNLAGIAFTSNWNDFPEDVPTDIEFYDVGIQRVGGGVNNPHTAGLYCANIGKIKGSKLVVDMEAVENVTPDYSNKHCMKFKDVTTGLNPQSEEFILSDFELNNGWSALKLESTGIKRLIMRDGIIKGCKYPIHISVSNQTEYLELDGIDFVDCEQSILSLFGSTSVHTLILRNCKAIDCNLSSAFANFGNKNIQVLVTENNDFGGKSTIYYGTSNVVKRYNL